jgi:hypothetical protein
MSTLQDALVKAKLSTNEQIQKSKEELQTTQKQQSKLSPPEKQLDSQFDGFEKLWKNEKSKPFLIHLLHSFLPFGDNHIIWTWEEKPLWKNSKKCCICQIETLSKQDLFDHFKEWCSASSESFFKSIKDPSFDSQEFMSLQKQKIFGERLFGVTSEKTSCIMCSPCYEIFSNWISTKMICEMHNGEFNKILTYIRKTSMAKAKQTNDINNYEDHSNSK